NHKDLRENQDKTQKCPQCDYIGTVKGLASHRKCHTSVKPYACKECEFSCFTLKELNTHISLNHGDEAFACSDSDLIGISSKGFPRHSRRDNYIQINQKFSNDNQNEQRDEAEHMCVSDYPKDTKYKPTNEKQNNSNLAENVNNNFKAVRGRP
ncbi:unnamed protein product, partial [Meganyctiphanes norvegica]